MLNHRHRNRGKKDRERVCPMYIFCCCRSKERRKKKKKNERNMRGRFDNQLEAAAFKIGCNISPNECESERNFVYYFTRQMRDCLTDHYMFNLQIMAKNRILLTWPWWLLMFVPSLNATQGKSTTTKKRKLRKQYFIINFP